MTKAPCPELPTTPSMKRPPDLLYASGERPPGATLIGLALQHTATALALIAYVLAAAKIGGLDSATTQAMITATVLAMALSTFLQSWGGRLGSGLLLVHIPDPLLVVISGLLAARYGTGGLVLVGLVNGMVAFGASTIMSRLRSLLPPTVAGVVVCVAGLSLVEPALQHLLGVGQEHADLGDMLAGVATLAVIMGLSIWGSQHGKLLALMAGLAAGIIISAFMGKLHGYESLAATPMFSLPKLPVPDFSIDISILIAIAVLALMTQLDAFGCAVLMHKMNDADWRRPDMKMASGAMRACGLGNMAGAFLGGYPTALSSANIALAHISRSTSRWIGLVVAVMLALIAFLPQISLALTMIPTPVIGAIEVYAAAYLVVSGIELIASRAMDARGVFMVGLSFVLGLGVVFIPELSQMVPASMATMAQNPIIVAGICAITLNLVFRLGISQYEEQSFDPGMQGIQLANAVVDFVESKGALWSARREVIRRAAQAALEAAEAIHAQPSRRLKSIHGSFDEFNFRVELRHEGSPMALGTKAEQLALTC